MKRLTILSHTEHYHTDDGTVVGLGATVTEINHLLDVFDHITHVAMLHPGTPPPHALPYCPNRVAFVPLPALGGPRASDKLSILLQAPKILKIVKAQLKDADYFQFRAPTGIGVFVIPYLIWCHQGKGWFKYAGNWQQAHAPLAYRWQRWLLTKQSRNVTINGFWEHQPSHCLSFENPCLTEEDLAQGRACMAEKTLQGPIDMCFVGRLEPAKGVDLILEAFMGLDAAERQKLGTVHLVGDGSRRNAYRELAERHALPFVFHGMLSREGVHDLYQRCHAMLLPSQSEGFPKVIAEAMNYGCVPIVSEVSSVGHYIAHGKHGFLLPTIDAAGLKACLQALLRLTPEAHRHMMLANAEVVPMFTYKHYQQQLLDKIL